MNNIRRKTYINGIPGKKWGIYNARAKSFQFGICEDTPEKAEFALFQQIGKDAYKWRFYPKVMSFRDIVQIKMEKEAYRLRCGHPVKFCVGNILQYSPHQTHVSH